MSFIGASGEIVPEVVNRPSGTHSEVTRAVAHVSFDS